MRARVLSVVLLVAASACSWAQADQRRLVAAFDPPNAALVTAVCRGDVSDIDEAIAAGADINVIGRGGYTPIFAALECNQARSVTALLDHGLDPNVRLPEVNEKRWDVGFTPLFIATVISDEAVLRALLDRGADPNAIKESTLADSGSSVLYMAITRERWGNFRVLLEHGADLRRSVGLGNRGDAFELLADQRGYCMLLELVPQMRRGDFAGVLSPIDFNGQFPESASEERCRAQVASIALGRTSVEDLVAYFGRDFEVPSQADIALRPEYYSDEAVMARRRAMAVRIRESLERRYLSADANR